MTVRNLFGPGSRWRSAAACLFWAMTLFLLHGCAGVERSAPIKSTAAAAPEVAGIPAGFFVPKGFFAQSKTDPGPKGGAPIQPVKTVTSIKGTLAPLVLEVVLYASPTTSAYYSSGGLDAKVNTRVWEAFLRKYKVPFRVVTSVEQLEKAQPAVLLLPSSVALSDRERLAVIGFRDRGGSVLASWLSGVRGERGDWKGFGFMEDVLNTKVVGDTQGDDDDNFMIVYGDNPISHTLPAGLRVWLERVKELYPLRLEGGQPAASIMDWSRTFVSGKSTQAIVFDERRRSSGLLSRSVVLGYPERLWLSADPKLMEAIAHNALMWLLRQPAAYLSAWPQPYSSALVMAVDAIEVMVDADESFSRMLEDAGGRATYYLLGDAAAKSAVVTKKIQARGHEIAYLGDRFEGFRDQPPAAQIKRLDTMRKAISDAGIPLVADAGFRAPMDSYDKTTEKLVKERPFGHFVAFMDATDARLPFFVSRSAEAERAALPLVVLPRTQTGPEEWMEEGDPDEGLQSFLGELDLADKMSGLSFVRVPNQSLMTGEQLGVMFKHLKGSNGHMWMPTANQLTQWWRERESVSARLEVGADGPVLVVNLAGSKRLTRPATVWVNLPESGSGMRLVDNKSGQKSPRIGVVDAWRASIVLDGLAPGEHRWSVNFDPAAKNAVN
jgi:hypothetical protein